MCSDRFGALFVRWPHEYKSNRAHGVCVLLSSLAANRRRRRRRRRRHGKHKMQIAAAIL